MICMIAYVCMFKKASSLYRESYFFLVLSGVHFSKLSSPVMSDPSDSQKSRCQMHQTHAFAAPYRHSPQWKWSPWTTTTQPKGWCKWWYKNSGAKKGSTPQLSYNPRQLSGITLITEGYFASKYKILPVRTHLGLKTVWTFSLPVDIE